MTFPLGLALPASAAVVALLGWRRPRVQAVGTALVAALTLVVLTRLEVGRSPVLPLWGMDVTWVQVTELNLVFAWAFALVLAFWSLYAWRLGDALERGAGLAYAGCSFGVLFAGDLLVLFLFWEGMAVFSTIVVVRGRSEASSAAGLRYLVLHVFGGVLLLTGIGLHAAEGHALAFDAGGGGGLLSLDRAASWLLFGGLLVNAAAWPLSAWVPDAYPTASPTGTVLLATFTTKVGVYALLVFFAGSTVLLVLGAVMALYGFLYAFATWDYRRLLAYSLVGQVGFMLAAAGAGGELGVKGAAAHAVSHVLYKALLFMSAGAVLAATGRAWGGGNRGLWRRMPVAALCGLVGALAISAAPFTNGFVSKTIVLDAVKHSEHALAGAVLWVLYGVSAAAPLYVGLRFPYLAFSGRGEGLQRRPTPVTARVAMGGMALVCLGMGVWPAPLFDLIGLHAHAIHVYTPGHVLQQLLLLAAGGVLFLAWWRAARSGRLEPRLGLPDTDVLYRGAVRGLVALLKGPLIRAFAAVSETAHARLPRALGAVARNPAGLMRLAVERVRMGWAGLLGSDASIDRAQARYQEQLGRYRRAPGGPWPIGRTVLFVALLLAVYVVLSRFW